MAPIITWTRRAEQQCVRAVARVPENATARETLDRRLTLAFATARDVVVLNYYVGFKPRPREHIVRVDVHEAEAAFTYVVKIADHERLDREVQAWKQCGITDSNPVFLKLMAVADPEQPARHVAVAYQDAEAHIGSESTMWLETAVRRCVRYDSPKLASVIGTLRDLFMQLGHLYEQGHLEQPNQGPIQTMPSRRGERVRHRLADSLALWGVHRPLAIRQQVNAAVVVGESRFLDPVDYYAFLESEQTARPHIPQLHRGLSHGDLHGRNSLVGIDADDQANFPTLFDYDSMHPDNLIGWDFVELETELKIRAYTDLFGHCGLLERVQAIIRLEWQLAEATRRLLEGREEPPTIPATGAERLLFILMAIRRHAQQLLGRLRAGQVAWLHEYLFLLGAYGLNTVRYDNQTEAERQAAYISAGVAAALWEQLVPKAAPLQSEAGPLAEQPHPSYQRPLQVARAWNRQPAKHEAASQLLEAFVQRYPAALHVHYEWAFNAISRSDRTLALARLHTIEERFGQALDEDTLSLSGRIHKELGDQHLAEALAMSNTPNLQQIEFEEADGAYEQAVTRYEMAYAVKQGSFPAINVATLNFMRAGLNHRLGHTDVARTLRQESQQVATAILGRRLQPVLPDDAIWVRATKAEAALLMGDWPVASQRYRSALGYTTPGSSAVGSMGRQIRRIAVIYRLLGEPIPNDAFAAVPELQTFLIEESST